MDPYEEELDHVARDALKEGRTMLSPFLALSDLIRAFKAMKVHAEMNDGLFENPPTEDQLIQIFSFLAIP